LSEPGCGAALINDCKYGYDVRGSVMRLSLLRGPKWPDPVADQGTHRFSYALMPHDGLAASLQRAGSVTEQAETFNLHLRAVPVNDAVGEPELPQQASVVTVEGAMISSVKRADAGDGIVVRIFEPAGSHGPMSLHLGEAVSGGVVAAERTDALERHLEDVQVAGDGSVAFALTPFELVTLKLLANGSAEAPAGV
jgi:alpha-mannosidase